MLKYFDFEKSIEKIDNKIQNLDQLNSNDNLEKISDYNSQKKNYIKIFMHH